MGLSPAARDSNFSRHLARLPRPRLKAFRRLASIRPREDQPGPGRSAVPHSGLPRDRQPSPRGGGLEALLGCSPNPSRSLGMSIINVETTPTQKSIELDSTPKPEREGKLIKQAAEVKPRPRPGDLIEIFRIGYEHWAIYVEDDYVVHLAPPSEEFEVGSITSVFSNRAVVKYSRLQDVLHGCSWKINNKLDRTYLPLPVDKIIQRTKNMINKIVQYSLIEGNCEHFVNDLRYGVHRSQQVEHALMNGAKAAGAVISAVVDSIRPKPLTA
uniref:Phospholipase A and acyltransferase 5 n=1 Tax=Spermophilus dauricus TaxID=99837 RepID=A0A8C9PWG8_SPEDA